MERGEVEEVGGAMGGGWGEERSKEIMRGTTAGRARKRKSPSPAWPGASPASPRPAILATAPASPRPRPGLA